MPSIPRLCQVLTALALSLCCASASSAGSPGAEEVRYVIDQDDGSPIPGAIVVATWRGTFGIHGAQACNRIESYVSGPDGSFRTPNDPKFGTAMVSAYKKGYERGNSPKGIQMASDGDYRHSQVVHYQWNESNTRGEIASVEPKIYTSRDEALRASRKHVDAFVRKSTKDRAGKLSELHGMRVEGNCVGPPQTTNGAMPFYEAIYAEQLELGDSVNELAWTKEYVELARPKK
jgi:hypothetical protein